jgi:hypothetical protein
MEYTKANFRAIREIVGMTQKELADTVGVDVHTVKVWEAKNTKWQPSPSAWEVLTSAKNQQDEVVCFSCDKARRVAQEAGEKPRVVIFKYWHDQKQYDEYHNSGSFGMANANTRLAAAILKNDGFEVSFEYV